MFNNIFMKKFKDFRSNTVDLDLQPCYKVLDEINNIKYNKLTDNELKELSLTLSKKALTGMASDALLPEAYALAREASFRVLGMKHYDVQVLAGIAMHHNALVEMQTGEGKTLAAVLPAYLNALAGRGVHVLTFNDYLAGRDAQWMGPIYEFLGMIAGHVGEGMSNIDRKKAYGCHITYLTAKECGFDYLRSFLCTDIRDLCSAPFIMP